MKTRRQSWLLTCFSALCLLFVLAMLFATVSKGNYSVCNSMFPSYESACNLRKAGR